MNFYIVVEGRRTEKKVFASWVPLLNPALTQVSFPGELIDYNFVIVSGFGWPNYLKVIEDAVTDVTNKPQFGQLVVSVDSEDDDPVKKKNDILEFISTINKKLVPLVIVQHCCVESWFLGNRQVIRRFPQTPEAQEWKQFYDVWADCPEHMPANTARQLNRANTAFCYLVNGIRDRAAHLSYSKRNPTVVCEGRYLTQLRNRADTTGHLASFREFVGIF